VRAGLKGLRHATGALLCSFPTTDSRHGPLRFAPLTTTTTASGGDGKTCGKSTKQIGKAQALPDDGSLWISWHLWPKRFTPALQVPGAAAPEACTCHAEDQRAEARVRCAGNSGLVSNETTMRGQCTSPSTHDHSNFGGRLFLHSLSFSFPGPKFPYFLASCNDRCALYTGYTYLLGEGQHCSCSLHTPYLSLVESTVEAHHFQATCRVTGADRTAVD